jgi:hypothetical protein
MDGDATSRSEGRKNIPQPKTPYPVLVREVLWKTEVAAANMEEGGKKKKMKPKGWEEKKKKKKKKKQKKVENERQKDEPMPPAKPMTDRNLRGVTLGPTTKRRKKKKKKKKKKRRKKKKEEKEGFQKEHKMCLLTRGA